MSVFSNLAATRENKTRLPLKRCGQTAARMSSLLAWCSEERAADSNVGTAAADTEFSLETMMAAVGLEFGKPVVFVAVLL